jgi:ribosome-binding protein aMBF1 (putative translation factor)
VKSENLKRFEKLASKDKSPWLEDAKWRIENEAWLDKSAMIALRILREIRRQKPINGMTQKVLAERMGVSPQYINKLVKGQENLTLETIASIEKVLGISLIEIPSIKVTSRVCS